jgi:hypothetical protein
LLPAPITTASALAPVTSEARARAHYAAGLDDGRLGHLALVALTAAADSVGPIAGSLLSALEPLGDTSEGSDAPFGLLGGCPHGRHADRPAGVLEGPAQTGHVIRRRCTGGF